MMSRAGGFLAVLLLCATIAAAGVSYDATSTNECQGCSTLTVGHTTTCPGGNAGLVASSFDISSTVTGMSYNGVALASIGAITFNTERVWGLLNPATGAEFNLVVSTSGPTDLLVAVSTICGVDQTTPNGPAVADDETTSASPFVTSSVTVPTDGMALNAAYICDFANTSTAVTSSGGTERANHLLDYGNGKCYHVVQTRTTTGTFSYSFDGGAITPFVAAVSIPINAAPVSARRRVTLVGP